MSHATDDNAFIGAKPVYQMMAHRSPILTVDVVLETEDGYLLIKRKYPPFKGKWALVGGHVEVGETVEQAAIREFKEETGMNIKLGRLIGVYSSPDRDPRGHYVTIAFEGIPKGNQFTYKEREEGEVDVIPEEELPKKLAFDHSKIIADYKDHKRFVSLLQMSYEMRRRPYDR